MGCVALRAKVEARWLEHFYLVQRAHPAAPIQRQAEGTPVLRAAITWLETWPPRPRP